MLEDRKRIKDHILDWSGELGPAVLVGIIVGLVILVVVVAVVFYGYVSGIWQWGGTEFDGASLWDWLDLLIVPVMVAVVGFLFNRAQKARDAKMEEMRARWVVEHQREREMELVVWASELRTQEDMLKAYYEQMDTLLAGGVLNAESSDGQNEALRLARVSTLRVLSLIDNRRKKDVLEFLRNSDLIQTDNPVIRLDGTDLQNSDLTSVDLSNVDLSGVNLS